MFHVRDLSLDLVLDFAEINLFLSLLGFQLHHLLFDTKNGVTHLTCNLADAQSVVVLGKNAGFTGHALSVGPENQGTVILENDKVEYRGSFSSY